MKGQRIWIISSLTEFTGNHSTAKRVASHLIACGASVTLLDSGDASSEGKIRQAVESREVDLFVAVHAYRAGRYVASHDVPYLIILGGTDVNEETIRCHPNWVEPMKQAIQSSSGVIAFNGAMKARAEEIFGCALTKPVQVIPQAVHVSCTDYSLRRAIGISAADILILLPCGLRPVKDALFTVDAVSAWRKSDPRVHLVVVGPTLDEEYGNQVKSKINGMACSGIRLLGPLLPSDLAAAIKEADIVANTSRCEGMCNTILEAQLLGTPVVARSNEGNRGLIVDGFNGLLFDTPEDFCRKAKLLLEDERLKRIIGENGKTTISALHNVKYEKASYQHALSEVLCKRHKT